MVRSFSVLVFSGTMAACLAGTARMPPAPPPPSASQPPVPEGAAPAAEASVEVNGLNLGPSRLALGRAHSCVRYASGSVRCWGANGRGQVGAPASAAPVTVPVVWPTKGAILLGAGGERTCVAADGASRLVRCSAGAPGAGPGATVLETPAVFNAASLSVSDAAVCLHQTAEYEGSRLQCDAPHAPIAGFALPHPCAPRSLCQKRYGFQVALRGNDACLLEQNGPASKLQCSRGAAWSYDGFEVTEGGEAMRAVALGRDFACVLGASGVRCWGPASPADSLEHARAVSGFPQASAICATATELCGIDVQGRLFCAPARTLAAREIRLPAGPGGAGAARATEIACGDAHACAITASGRVACWGDNSMGQLGDGTTRTPSSPAGAPEAVWARVPPVSEP